MKVQLLFKKKLWAFENFQIFSFLTRFQENPIVLVRKIWKHQWENGHKIIVLRETNIKCRKVSGGEDVNIVKF